VLAPTPSRRGCGTFSGPAARHCRPKLVLTDRQFLSDLNRACRICAEPEPIGPARLIELEREGLRGGMTLRRWKILCRAARLEAIERSNPDGKFEEFMIAKRED
jgi:hypothetical protein